MLNLAVDVATLFEDKSCGSNCFIDFLLRISRLVITLEFMLEVVWKLVNHDAPVPRLRQVVDCSFEQLNFCVLCVSYDLV